MIPRSILKRNNPGNLVKDKRLQEETEEFIRYQEQQKILKLQQIEIDEFLGKYDAVLGK